MSLSESCPMMAKYYFLQGETISQVPSSYAFVARHSVTDLHAKCGEYENLIMTF